MKFVDELCSSCINEAFELKRKVNLFDSVKTTQRRLSKYFLRFVNIVLKLLYTLAIQFSTLYFFMITIIHQNKTVCHQSITSFLERIVEYVGKDLGNHTN